ncbi:hypothetical protein BU23DRAFT_559688 [Bimuria novae-zelandiae CBS 107.79]|uniref:Uncharacterized protein n=1 Tax=Bimuria novae-zelandiae CBS 107.79 TaxID=1447943 RepID=A0A6A5UVU4_9PLEO|nr:hypothetical protein BU23DRAFT_559688 [Bimuria novae-zelandiae CBS 107.79]
MTQLVTGMATSDISDKTVASSSKSSSESLPVFNKPEELTQFVAAQSTPSHETIFNNLPASTKSTQSLIKDDAEGIERNILASEECDFSQL